MPYLLENLQIFNDMFTPLGLNHTHKTRAATNHFFFLISLRDKLLTMELTLRHLWHHQPGLTFRKHH